MAMTRAQWNALQNRLPAEDRTPYESYLSSQGLIPQTFTPSALAAGESGAIGAASISSQMATAVQEAEKAIIPPEPKPQVNPWDEPPYPAPAGKVWKWVGAKSVGRPGSGSWKLYNAAGSTTTVSTTTVSSSGNQNVYKGSGTTGDPLTFNGVPFTGTYNGNNYVNGVLTVKKNDSTGNNFSGSGTKGDPLLLNGAPYNGVLGGVQYVNGIAQTAGTSTEDAAKLLEDKQRKSAQQDFLASLNELGLGDLYSTINDMITQDYTVAKIKLELPKTDAYKLRFPGMAALKAAGRAISEATYISNERGYLQTLRAYGLDTAVLGSRSRLGTYIENEVSPREFEERVNLAATRVDENPDVLAAFKTFYPETDKGGVVAYLLDPKAGMDIIKKQVRTSEIGAAAIRGGFAQQIVGAEYAGTLIGAVGETGYAQIVNEFQRAKQLADTQRRLAQIEQKSYSDLEAIGAVVGDDVTKLLASQQRASREVARFSGAGGLSAGSLRTAEIGI